MTDTTPRELAAFDAAVAAELPRVSHVEYDSHEICKHFAGKVRERLVALTQQAEPEASHLFELWWAEYMPEASQRHAWNAWNAAPRAYDATPPSPSAAQPSGEVLTKAEIDFILADAFLAANGSVYSTRIYDFVRAIESATLAKIGAK